MRNSARLAVTVLVVVVSSLAQVRSDNSPYQPNATPSDRAAGENLKRSAEAGSAQAQNELSKQYMEGKIFKPNVPEAVKWVRAAADQGLAEAEVDLAILCLEGRGVPRDYAQGFSWMQKAANQDDPKAAYNVGSLYGLGRGVPQDVDQGVHWFLKAAELGNPAGAYKMGVASEQGASVSRDLVKAYMWYYIASSRYDYYWSKEPLGEIGPKIGPAGIEDARKQADLWIKEHPKHQAGPYDAP